MGHPFSDEDDHQTWDIGSWECASHRRIILILHAYVFHVTQTWEGRVLQDGYQKQWFGEGEVLLAAL